MRWYQISAHVGHYTGFRNRNQYRKEKKWYGNISNYERLLPTDEIMSFKTFPVTPSTVFFKAWVPVRWSRHVGRAEQKPVVPGIHTLSNMLMLLF